MAPTACKFFAQGKCRRGSSCRFSHIGDRDPATVATQTKTSSASTSTGSHRGNRGWGERRNSNRPVPENPTRTSEAAGGPSNSNRRVDKGKGIAKPPETHERILGSSMLVTFGAGLSIESLTPQLATSSTVFISNLPADTSTAEIHRLVSKFQKDLAQHTIRVSRTISNNNMNSTDNEEMTRATIPFCDTTTANHAITSLNGSTYRSRELTCTSLQSTGTSQNMMKINCRWFLPSAMAYVNFTTAEAARTASAQAGERRIHGQKVNLKPPRIFRGLHSVMVTGVNADTTAEEIAAVFGCLTSAVKLKPPLHCGYSATGATAYVKGLFQNVEGAGPLLAFEVLSDSGANMQRALVRFESPEVTRNVVKQLNDKKLDTLGGCKLKLDITYSTRFSVASDIYRAVADDLKALAEKKQDNDNTTQSFDGATLKIFAETKNLRRPAALFINGRERSAVVKLKAAVQKIIRGEVVCDNNGQVLWDSTLSGYDGRMLVSRAASFSSAHSYCDPRNRTITLYGSPEARQRARETLLEMRQLQQDTRRHEIPLTTSSMTKALNGGLTAVQEQLTLRGLNALQIDIVNKRAVIHCDPSEFQMVKHLFDRAVRDDDGSNITSENSCVVCMDEAEAPTEAPCRHTYCKDCISSFINSTNDTRNLPIRCYGHPDQPTPCGQSFSIDFLTRILSATELDQLCALAFSTYIQQHPEQYHYCPTPDCDTVYLIHDDKAEKNATITCQQCFTGVCTSCKTEAHDGQTCAEYQDATNTKLNDRRFDEWKDSNNVKLCPRCGASIEKTEGCNHMTCFICKTHLCWNCMKVFEENTIYHHIAGCTTAQVPAAGPRRVVAAPAAVPQGNGDVQFRQWRRLNNIKTCPRCGFDIEKGEGDDHVVCHCGAHLCWACLGVFDPVEVYAHMQQCQLRRLRTAGRTTEIGETMAERYGRLAAERFGLPAYTEYRGYEGNVGGGGGGAGGIRPLQPLRRAASPPRYIPPERPAPPPKKAGGGFCTIM